MDEAMKDLEQRKEAIQEQTSEQTKTAAGQPETEETGGKKGGKKEKKTVGQEIISWVSTILVAVVAALLIRSFVFEPVRVDGHSMDDTLADGEIMLVTKFDYSTTWLSLFWQSDEQKEQAPRLTFGGNPSRFDVVICRYPDRGDTNFVKRVIGLPGDTLSLTDGYLTVNGEAYPEAYINDSYRTGHLNTVPDYRVPKKGDSFSVLLEENYYSFLLNGETWNILDTTMKCRDESGKQLTVKGNGTMFLYDGKTYSREDTSGLKALLEELNGKTFTVDEDYYFVMGDHRNNSNDSRSVGPIERTMIVGHVRHVLFPFNKWRGVN